MNEIEIKRHSFDLAKNRLKEFSEKKEAELAIDKVRTEGGIFGLGDHKVTGYELNKRLEFIQGHLIDINSTNNGTIKEFKEVYNALDALDKDYIASIVASVKAIEKTSNDVRTQQDTLKHHNVKLTSQQNKLDYHQIEIEKTVASIKKIVAALSEKITSDIANANAKNEDLVEQLNKDILALRKEVDSFNNYFSDLSKKTEDTANRLDEQIPTIQEVLEFVNQMSDIIHLNEVDSMWEQRNVLKTDLADTNNSVITLQQKTIEMGNDIVDKTEKMQYSIALLERKLKYAYFIAGGALGLVVVELLLALTGVI